MADKLDYLLEIAKSPNVCDMLSEKKLTEIGQTVMSEYDSDKNSRADWERQAKRSLELAEMKYQKKDTPWENASNVKFPIIARAALQFSANALAEIVRQGRVVETVVFGKDPDETKMRRARRVEDFLNYQLLYKNSYWQDSIDRTMQLLSVVGTVFRKVYFDPVSGENISELCMYDEVVVNDDISSLHKARRVSHAMKLHTNNIVEMIRAGVYVKVPDEILHPEENDVSDKKLHEIIEQHRYLDLDDDGYEEPYIVTVLKQDAKVLRIYPRFETKDILTNEAGEIRYIKPCQYFVDYHCIPSPTGGFYSMGFGALLTTINETVNTGINQLIDSGTLANTKTGFISKGFNIRSGDFTLSMGKMIKVNTIDGDVSRGVHMLDFKEPSSVLFQLMGLLDQTAKELSTTTDIMTGNQLAQNAPATSVMSLIERGMKVYNSILKRIFRELTTEFQLYFKLNSRYLDPIEYMEVLDDQEAAYPDDWVDRGLDVKTIANPEMASDAQRLAQAQMLMGIIDRPGINQAEILRRYLEAGKIPNIENVMQQQQANQTEVAMQLQQQMQQMEQMLAQKEMQLKELDLQLKAQKLQVDNAVKIEKTKQAAAKQQFGMQEAMVNAQLHDKEIMASLEEAKLKIAGDITKAEITADAKESNANTSTD